MPHFSSSGQPNTPSPLRLIGVCHFKASLLSKFQNELNGKDNDSQPKRAMSLPFLIDIIRSFSNLALPPLQMTKSAKEFLGLLDNTQEYGHGFDVELSGLDVMNDAFAIIGK